MSFNVQPGIIIDYSDGANKLDKNYKADQSEKADEKAESDKADAAKNKSQNGKMSFSMDEFAKGSDSQDGSDDVTRSAPEQTYSYIGNRNSHVFHYPDCDSVNDMKEKNKVYFEDATRDEVMEQGFRPCQRCKP